MTLIALLQLIDPMWNEYKETSNANIVKLINCKLLIKFLLSFFSFIFIGYCSLVGSDSESYGWDIVRSRFIHNKKETTYPVWLSTHDKFTIPDEFTVVLDMDEGTLGFIVDGLYLGVAYAGLTGKKLYPVISTVWGNVEIGIRYTGYMPPGPLLLRECCRKTIRQHSGKKRIRKLINEARIPLVLKEYLLN